MLRHADKEIDKARGLASYNNTAGTSLAVALSREYLEGCSESVRNMLATSFIYFGQPGWLAVFGTDKHGLALR